MAGHNDEQKIVSVTRGPERTPLEPVTPGPAQRMLDVFIGKWITQGQTAAADVPPLEIAASDVYEWAPGGFFVVHSAYGRVGEIDVGGMEIMGHDPDSGAYRSFFFDSRGNVVTSTLSLDDGVWTWKREGTRASASFSTDGRTQTAHHERSADGSRWEPSMEVTLRKVG